MVITVFIQDLVNDFSGQLIGTFSLVSETSKTWIKQHLELPVGTYHIGFEAIIGVMSKSDVALDRVRLEDVRACNIIIGKINHFNFS